MKRIFASLLMVLMLISVVNAFTVGLSSPDNDSTVQGDYIDYDFSITPLTFDYAKNFTALLYDLNDNLVATHFFDLVIEHLGANSSTVNVTSIEHPNSTITNPLEVAVYNQTWLNFSDSVNNNVMFGNGSNSISAQLSGKDAFSISIWLNSDDFDDGLESYIFSAATAASPALDIFEDEIGGRTELCAGGSSDASDYYITCTGNVTSFTGEWIHFAAVYNYANNSQEVYLNGVINNSQASVWDSTTYTGSTTVAANDMLANFQVLNNFAWNGGIDEVMLFSRNLSASEVLSLYNQGRRKNATALANPDERFLYLSFNENNSTTAYNTPINSTSVIPNGTIVGADYLTDNIYVELSNTTDYIITNSILQIINPSWAYSFMTIASTDIDYVDRIATAINEYTINMTGCAFNSTGSACISFNNYLVGVGVDINYENYDTTALDTESKHFNISVDTDESIYSGSTTATLYYDDTAYTPTSTGGGGLFNEKIFTVNIDVPAVSVEENKTFYWEMSVVNSTGSTNKFNTTFQNQTVTPTNIVTCGSSQFALNVSVYDESTQASITTDAFDSIHNWFLGGGSETKNISFTNTSLSSYYFCVTPNQTYYDTVHLEVEKSGYNSRNFDFSDLAISNGSVSKSIYLLNSSAGRTVTLQITDAGFIGLEDYTVRVTKIDDNIVVEEQTTDNFGHISAVLIENTVKYKIEIFDTNNTLVRTSDSVIIVCPATTGLCKIQITVEEDLDLTNRFNPIPNYFNSEISFNNATNIFSVSWNDGTGDSPTHTLAIEKLSFAGSTTVCTSNSTALAGSLTCNITEDGQYRATLTRTVGGEDTVIITYTRKVGGIVDDLGYEGMFWSFILLMTAVLMAIFSPSVAIIIYLVMFVLLVVIGVIEASLILVFAQIAIGGIGLWFFRR